MATCAQVLPLKEGRGRKSGLFCTTISSVFLFATVNQFLQHMILNIFPCVLKLQVGLEQETT